jgi:hypothetical protein
MHHKFSQIFEKYEKMQICFLAVAKASWKAHLRSSNFERHLRNYRCALHCDVRLTLKNVF